MLKRVSILSALMIILLDLFLPSGLSAQEEKGRALGIRQGSV